MGTYNSELVRCIEDLREKREEVNRSILRDEEEKARCQRELTAITERLGKLNEGLARKMQARLEFDQTIQETEAAYMKVRRRKRARGPGAFLPAPQQRL
jgi:Sjoegren syndrome nuclear autoantigen 1